MLGPIKAANINLPLIFFLSDALTRRVWSLFIAFKKHGPIRNLKKKPNVFSKEEQIRGESMNWPLFQLEAKLAPFGFQMVDITSEI